MSIISDSSATDAVVGLGSNFASTARPVSTQISLNYYLIAMSFWRLMHCSDHSVLRTLS